MKIVILTMAVALMVLLTSAVNLAQNETRNIGTNLSGENIVEVATADGDFDTLVSALNVTGLAGTLSGPGPYTVFAPTDEAFLKLPPGVLENLTTNESQRNTLRDILTYHVVPGIVLSSDLRDGMVLRTMEGGDLKVTVENGQMMVNGVNIVRPSINASNGVIHAIDAVLIPAPASAVATAEKPVIAEPTPAAANATQPAAGKPYQPGFEGSLAIIGMLAVAFLIFRRRN